MKEKSITIKDVATQAGVSISVVSYILNNTPGKTVTAETRQRVLDIAKSLDYSPNSIARGMRTKRSMNIGLVSFWKVSDAVFIQILDGVTKSAGENEYNIVLCGICSDKKEFEYAELFKKRIIDGVILVSPPEGTLPKYDEKRHVDIINKYKIPSVIINGYTIDDSLNYIDIDYYNSTLTATKYLINLGHKKIAYILPNETEAKHQRAIERLRGFKDALYNHELPIIEDDIYKFEDVKPAFFRDCGNKGFTGVVVNKSNYARNFLLEAQKNGIRIPEDISVIAANTEFYTPFLFPPLTSVEIPLSEMGGQSVRVLLDSMAGKIGSMKLKFPNGVNERGSCRRLYADKNGG